MSSKDRTSAGSTPSPSSDKKSFTGPAPKAQPEDFTGIGEDGMPLNPTGGDQTVQFIPGQDPVNGDAKIEISDNAVAPQFSGMGKEELMQYANDPYWIRLRWALFILFWILWVAMLAGAVIIIVLAPKCSDKKSEPDTYYQVYVKSFANGGKLSDLKERADYLKDLGVKTVIISQVLSSDGGGGTQNVIDFKNVDPVFGTLADFKSAVTAFKEKGLSVLLQLIPNHSGVKHSWFNNSATADYYVRKAATDVQGSNWETVEGKNAWEEDTLDASNMYLRQFGVMEADLNYGNPAVIDEMNKVLKFWLDQGVNGFLLSDVSYLVEDLTKLKDPSAMKNQPNNSDIIGQLVPKGATVLVDTDGVSVGSEKYNNYRKANVLPIVTDLGVKLKSTSQASDVHQLLETLWKADNGTLALRLSGPKIDRVQKNVGSLDRANLVAMVAFTMNSKVILYYGDELGNLHDPTVVASSAPEKGVEPMNWEGTKSSNVKYFKRLIELQRTINSESQSKISFNTTGTAFVIKRSSEACTYILVANFGSSEAAINFADFDEPTSAKALVLAVTPNNADIKQDATITEGKLELPGDSGVIIKLDASK